MLLIFILSSQTSYESNQLTTGITKAIVNSIKIIIPDSSLDTLSFNHIVRKNSHFFIYCFLGILLSITVGGNGAHKYRNKGIVLLVCILYAALDEFHQMFVLGRGPGIKDVYIDCVGAVTGIVMYAIFAKTLLKIRKLLTF
jgi:VanZ family protein